MLTQCQHRTKYQMNILFLVCELVFLRSLVIFFLRPELKPLSGALCEFLWFFSTSFNETLGAEKCQVSVSCFERAAIVLCQSFKKNILYYCIIKKYWIDLDCGWHWKTKSRFLAIAQ